MKADWRGGTEFARPSQKLEAPESMKLMVLMNVVILTLHYAPFNYKLPPYYLHKFATEVSYGRKIWPELNRSSMRDVTQLDIPRPRRLIIFSCPDTWETDLIFWTKNLAEFNLAVWPNLILHQIFRPYGIFISNLRPPWKKNRRTLRHRPTTGSLELTVPPEGLVPRLI